MKQVNILNITLDNFSMQELLEKLKLGGVVYTPNIDHIMKLQKDETFRRVYQEADYRVCDSQLLMFASRFLGQPIKEKISGSDLFPAFYSHYKDDPNVKIFLLGGQEGSAAKALTKINRKVGREIVVGCYCPPFGFEHNLRECQKIVNLIDQSGATVLAIGVGAPKQEKWISQYKYLLPKITTFFAIGATIEFEAEYRRRAPQWISQAGLEWLYRLLQEPKRLWRRYLIDDTAFFILILLQKLGLYPTEPKFSSRKINLS